MKRLIPIILVLLLSANLGYAQHPKWEKIKALKTAHITDALELTSEEAEKFWPIYNAMQKNMFAQRAKLKKMRYSLGEDLDKMSEADAKELLNEYLKIQDEINNSRKAMIVDLMPVLSAKKIIKLKKAEDDFNRKMLKEYRNHHRGKKDGGGPPKY